MITRCCRCRRAGLLNPRRNFHGTVRLLTPPESSPPAATSTSAAQPFSTPFTPSPAKVSGLPKKKSPKPQPPKSKSSIPAGSILRGLAYLKNKDAPLALEDDAYPAWLWTLLDAPKLAHEYSSGGAIATGEGAGDAFAKSKKQRRLAAKAEKARGVGADGDDQFSKFVPPQEQTVNLPTAGQEAIEARKDLRTGMRVASRKKIKEGNFLRSMG